MCKFIVFFFILDSPQEISIQFFDPWKSIIDTP